MVFTALSMMPHDFFMKEYGAAMSAEKELNQEAKII